MCGFMLCPHINNIFETLTHKQVNVLDFCDHITKIYIALAGESWMYRNI